MYGPISTTGRAIMASVRQLEQSGMPRDQAIATARQRLMDNIDPDIEKMMFQVQQLQQQRQQPPQMTIRDQLNQVSGINTLPNPDFNPRFAGGGIVAFAGPEGSLVIDEMMPPRMTPEQINLQREMQRAAERRMGLVGSGRIGLENFPEMIEDVPESQRVVSRVVDDQGNIWEKTREGEWRQARRFGLGSLGTGESPMKREATAYRTGTRDVRGLPQPDVTVDRTTGRVTDRRPGIGGAPAEKPSLLRRGVGALGAIAGIGGVGSLITDLRERAAREKEEAGPVAPVNPYALPGDRFSGYREQRGPIALGAINLDEGAIQNVKDSLSSFISGATGVGLFGSREAEKAQEKKPEAKPQAKPKPIAKPGAAAPATRQPGLFDIPIQIESARAQVAQGMTEEKLFQEEDARARKEQTGPYSQRFTEGDRIKAQRLAELKDSKDRSFARGLVAAGLAMAEQASKGGQPGSETQKFFAAAVAGLGGYAKAQETISTELKKAQKEYDELTFNLETMREEAKGQLHGKAWEKYKYHQDQAEKARDNARGLMIVQAQLETSMGLAGVKAATQMAGIQQRAQSALINAALKDLENDLGYQQLKLKQAQGTPQERAAAERDIEAAIQAQAQRIMSIPSRAAALQYETSGVLDTLISSADEIANAALGAGG